ncbi:MAG TPA: hypothetical protein VEZ89_17750, partial [Rubrivivax sp.]|nr:hypothetical protein [Rubrivivax sp.]
MSTAEVGAGCRFGAAGLAISLPGQTAFQPSGHQKMAAAAASTKPDIHNTPLDHNIEGAWWLRPGRSRNGVFKRDEASVSV